MAKGVNKVILVGHLGQDPELRNTPSGDAVATASLATTESWKGKDGQKQERTEWHRLVFWRKLAEVVGEYLHKGSLIYVEGKLQTRKWQAQDGSDRYSTEIVVSEMQMLDSKGSGGGDARPREQAPKRSPDPQQAPGGGSPGDIPFDDDIPF